MISRELYNVVAKLCGMSPAKVRLWESLDQYAEYDGAGGATG